MVDDTIAEEWRPVEGHPGYEVSSLGRVRSIDRYIKFKPTDREPTGRTRFYPGQVLNPTKGKRGYLVVQSSRQQTPRMVMAVHLLVCTAFHGPRPSPKHEVAHWNNNPLDNHKDNLRWATSAENKSDMLRHGTNRRGQQMTLSKLTEAKVTEMRRMRASGVTFQAIADSFHIGIGTAYKACTGQSWSHVP